MTFDLFGDGERPRRGGPPRLLADVIPGRCCQRSSFHPGHHDLDGQGGTVDALAGVHQGQPPPTYVPSQPPANATPALDREEVDPHAPAANPGHPPQPAAGTAAPLPAPAAAEHLPQTCPTCGAKVWWAKDVATGRSLCVDADPVPEGTIVLRRRGTAAIARELAPGEAPGPGEKTRKRHPYPCTAEAKHHG